MKTSAEMISFALGSFNSVSMANKRKLTDLFGDSIHINKLEACVLRTRTKQNEPHFLHIALMNFLDFPQIQFYNNQEI